MARNGSTRIELSGGESFDPLPLAADDLVPTSMLLVLVYPYRMDHQMLAAGLRRGLKAFPHLTGEIFGSTDPIDLSIRPSSAGVYLDVAQSKEPLNQQVIEAMTLAEQASHFAPPWSFNHRWHGETDRTPLFHASLTTSADSPNSVLSLFASHMAIDGTGLMLTLAHSTAVLHNVSPPPVFHHRRVLECAGETASQELPHRYVQRNDQSQALLGQWDAVDSFSLGIFTVSVESIRRQWAVKSLKDARLALTAKLCTLLREYSGQPNEVALWCDPRGTAGIPKTYTGNTGCYVHVPLSDENDADLANRLRALSTRHGFNEITKTYRAIKAAEARGDIVVWDGMAPGVVPVNLVPFSRIGMDWGQGQPVFGQMLSRNSHGLRIWTSPDGNRLLVEAVLRRPLPERLIESCRDLDLVLSHRLES